MSAIVLVGPALSASGSRSGSARRSLARANPHEVPGNSRLLPRSTKLGGAQFDGAGPVLLAMIVFLTDVGPNVVTAPNAADEFDATVTLISVSSVATTFPL